MIYNRTRKVLYQVIINSSITRCPLAVKAHSLTAYSSSSNDCRDFQFKNIKNKLCLLLVRFRSNYS